MLEMAFDNAHITSAADGSNGHGNLLNVVAADVPNIAARNARRTPGFGIDSKLPFRIKSGIC